ncbi:MAG: HAMP domain-containing histidine kinase [Candidatus Gracilibacteria bacterium]|nr:HAMP domain-containing histidine kinase [Candidatus Gracilibacteria bacterium]
MDQKLQSTQRKLTLIFSLLVFGISSILQISFFSHKYITGIQKETQKIEKLAQSISERKLPLRQIDKIIKNERKFGRELTVSQPENKDMQKGKIMNFVILDSENSILIQNIRGEVNVESLKESLEKKDTEVHREQSTLVKYLPIDRYLDTYQLLLFKELNYTAEDYFSDMITFLIAIGLFSILFYVIGYFFVKRVLQPVEKNINEMTDFIHNAGHELKTPLSVISSNLQLMGHSGTLNKNMLQENIGEIHRLDKLLEALITLSELKQSNVKTYNDIKQEWEYIFHEFQTDIQKKEIEICLDIEESFLLECDREYLYIFLSNIFKNAVSFSKQGGKIEIQCYERVCKVIDHGSGIAPENIPKIFSRFFQEKTERNNGGFGIGLALVAKISQFYNWKIEVESEKGKGTTFIIIF